MQKVALHVRDEQIAAALSGALSELEPNPAAAVSLFQDNVRGGWSVEAYFDDRPDMARIDAAVASLLESNRDRPKLERVPERNWVAISQAALPPVTAGRFVVHGGHDKGAAGGRRRYAIQIDAGEAFGTAHHASTLGCLMALDRLAKERSFRSVLDLGCGSGILAIAAARLLPRATIVASDHDPLAVNVARANARINRVGGRVTVLTAEGPPRRLSREPDGLSLVLANILAEPLIELAPRLSRVVASRGRVVLSGLLEREARRVTAAYVAAGFSLRHRVSLAGWATLVLERRHRGSARGRAGAKSGAPDPASLVRYNQ
jgi:ribosomal protein L11 methyltransferase